MEKRNEELAKDVFGKAPKDGICLSCGMEAAPRCHSEEGRREYKISGLCEECFDALFQDEEL